VHLRRSNHAVTLWQVNLPCESLQKNFLTCDNYDSVIYGRALTVPDGWPIHITWAAMAFAIMAWGPGRLSIDHALCWLPGLRAKEAASA